MYVTEQLDDVVKLWMWALGSLIGVWDRVVLLGILTAESNIDVTAALWHWMLVLFNSPGLIWSTRIRALNEIEFRMVQQESKIFCGSRHFRC